MTLDMRPPAVAEVLHGEFLPRRENLFVDCWQLVNWHVRPPAEQQLARAG